MAEEVEYGQEWNSEYMVLAWKHGKQDGSHTWSQGVRESKREDLLG